MSKIHVLPDENLGGGPNGQILREYVEVDRAANVGDKIVIVNPCDYQLGVKYTKGTVMTVTKADEDGDVYCGIFKLIDKNEYQTLEPTDIVHIDGARYRLVDRKAKVGEKIIVVNAHLNGESYKNGDIFIVREVRHSVIFVTVDSGRYIALSHFEYNVLDPVEPTENKLVTAEEGDDKSVLDLLANLARRVTELERQQKENREYIIKAFEGISGKDDEWTVEERVAILERTFTEYMRRVNTIETDIEELNTDLATIEETAKELERAHETLKRRQVIENIHVLKRRQERLFEEINAIYRRIDALDERTQPLVKPFGEESPFATVATIPTFKYSDLVGKTLKIYGGRDGEYATVFGYDESTGKSYVLFSGKEGDADE